MASYCERDEEIDEKDSYSISKQREKKRHAVHNFFIYSESRKASQCKKENCQAWICGKNPTNLTNHLKKLCHKIVYEKFLKKVEESNILKRYTKLKSVMCHTSDKTMAKKRKVAESNILKRYTKLKSVMCHTSDKTMAKKKKLGCCVPGCFPKKNLPRRFFDIPQTINNQGDAMKEITQKRREAWYSVINNPKIKSLKRPRICSVHFVSGRPTLRSNYKYADVALLQNDIDWVPSLHMKKPNSRASTSTKNRKCMCVLCFDGQVGLPKGKMKKISATMTEIWKRNKHVSAGMSSKKPVVEAVPALVTIPCSVIVKRLTQKDLEKFCCKDGVLKKDTNNKNPTVITLSEMKCQENFNLCCRVVEFFEEERGVVIWIEDGTRCPFFTVDDTNIRPYDSKDSQSLKRNCFRICVRCTKLLLGNLILERQMLLHLRGVVPVIDPYSNIAVVQFEILGAIELFPPKTKLHQSLMKILEKCAAVIEDVEPNIQSLPEEQQVELRPNTADPLIEKPAAMTEEQNIGLVLHPLQKENSSSLKERITFGNEDQDQVVLVASRNHEQISATPNCTTVSGQPASKIRLVRSENSCSDSLIISEPEDVDQDMSQVINLDSSAQHNLEKVKSAVEDSTIDMKYLQHLEDQHNVQPGERFRITTRIGELLPQPCISSGDDPFGLKSLLVAFCSKCKHSWRYSEFIDSVSHRVNQRQNPAPRTTLQDSGSDSTVTNYLCSKEEHIGNMRLLDEGTLTNDDCEYDENVLIDNSYHYICPLCDLRNLPHSLCILEPTFFLRMHITELSATNADGEPACLHISATGVHAEYFLGTKADHVLRSREIWKRAEGRIIKLVGSQRPLTLGLIRRVSDPNKVCLEFTKTVFASNHLLPWR